MADIRATPGRPDPGGTRRPHLTAVAVYSATACLFTWPLALHLRTLFGTDDPGGDPSLHLWTLGWNLHALFTQPASWLTGRVFDANIFFPASGTLAYSDHLLLQSLALAPVFAATGDLVLCYNLLLLGSLVASAWAMHTLARTLVASEPAAYVAGLVYGFAPYHFTHLTHVQLQAMYFLPLSLLFLHRVFARARRADTVGLGLVIGLQAASSIYYAVIGAVAIASAALTLAVFHRRTTDWRLWRRGLAAFGLAALVALPWTVPYVRVSTDSGAGRGLFEAARGSAVPASYLQAPPTNLVYGRSGWLRPGDGQRLPRRDGPEHGLFLGFSVMLLAAIGAFVATREMRPVITVYVVLAATGFVLSLGPDGVRPLYAALHQTLPGMQAIRAPARFGVLVLFGCALLSAAAVRTWDHRRWRGRAVLPACALAAIGVEYANGSIEYPARPALQTEAGAWLASQPGTGAVVCLPMGIEAANTPCMLQSLEHWRRIVNGYSGIRPPFFSAVADAMSRMPSAESLLTLHELGVQYVVSDTPLAAPPPLEGVLVERARLGDQQVYEVAWSPDVLSVLIDGEAVPPPPGPAIFAVGESATYRVLWTSGPIEAAAGAATIAVAPTSGSEAFRFRVTAQTAEWMTRFYEMEARLETSTNQALLPLEHTETIVEGRRRVNRRQEFDAANRRLVMTTGDSAVTLTVGANARDPLAALFYLRTLPLEPGTSVSIPLTNNGRAMTLEVHVGGVESLELNGRLWSAWRIEPRVRQRIERRRPPALSAWLSADERRIPILIVVEADFGRARVELVDYRVE